MPDNEFGYAVIYPWPWNSIWFENVDGKVLEQLTTLGYGQFSRFAPAFLMVIGIDITGCGGAANTPKISIGNNAPDYNNVFPETQLTGLLSTQDSWIIIMPKSSIMPDPNIPTTLRVTKASNATTYNFRALLLGLDQW